MLVTVSTQGVLTAWRMTIRGPGSRRGDVSLQREGTLRGHTRTVTCLASSPAWSLLVSGSEVHCLIRRHLWLTNTSFTGRISDGMGYEPAQIYSNTADTQAGSTGEVLCGQRRRREPIPAMLDTV